jgi:hypothetical protein
LNKEEMQAIERNKPYVPRRDSTEHNPVFAPLKNGLDQVWNTLRSNPG